MLLNPKQEQKIWKGSFSQVFYLQASFSLVPPVAHLASLLCAKSYTGTEGDARVYGSAQRPGQGKQDTGQTTCKKKNGSLHNLQQNVFLSQQSLQCHDSWRNHEGTAMKETPAVVWIPLFITQINSWDTVMFFVFFLPWNSKRKKKSYKIFTKPSIAQHIQ